MRIMLTTASLLGAMCVVMGAIGGHENSANQSVWMTGVYLGLIHAAASLALHNLLLVSRAYRFPAFGFVLGGWLFSGSIFLKVSIWGTRSESVDLAGRSVAEWVVSLTTPLGGIVLISSWIALTTISALHTKSE